VKSGDKFLADLQRATALYWFDGNVVGCRVMTRYFFDVVGHGRSALDYSGLLLPTLDRARDTAELLAIDLAVTSESDEDVIGCTVCVSNADGNKLFSVPVHTSCLAAA